MLACELTSLREIVLRIGTAALVKNFSPLHEDEIVNKAKDLRLRLMDGAHHRARASLAQVLQGAHQRQSSGGVKTGRRLIQEEQFRPGDQFHRHAQTFSLTT